MTTMQQQGNDVLNAVDESQVQTVIELFERKILPLDTKDTFRGNVYDVLVKLDMSENDITYWLDWFGLK